MLKTTSVIAMSLMSVYPQRRPSSLVPDKKSQIAGFKAILLRWDPILRPFSPSGEILISKAKQIEIMKGKKLFSAGN